MSRPETAAETCPACGATDYRLMFRVRDTLCRSTDKLFSVVECRTCRLLQLSPRPDPGELRHYYPTAYSRVPGGCARAPLAESCREFLLRGHVRFTQRALERSKAKGLVLDAGCGSGLFLKMMRARGYRGAGLAFSLRAAGVAWEENRVPAACASLSNAPLADESCAVITLFHVLEHLYEPLQYLETAHRLLCPEGRLIVQVPNAASWQFLLLGERWRGLDVPRHLWNFKASDLETLLDRSGFEVLRTKHFVLRDSPAYLATSLAPGLDPLVREVQGIEESPRQEMVKDLLYSALFAACVPITLLESACRAGCTVMIEARKKS